MIDVAITINDKVVNSRLDRMQYMLTGPVIGSLLQTTAVPLLREDARRRFSTEGASDGEKWVPLKQATIDIRRTRGFAPGPINVRTGLMRNYVTTALGQTVSTPSYTQLTWPGTQPMDNSPLGYAYHTAQAGSSVWGTPPRPVVRLSPKVIVALYAVMASHVRSSLKGRVS